MTISAEQIRQIVRLPDDAVFKISRFCGETLVKVEFRGYEWTIHEDGSHIGVTPLGFLWRRPEIRMEIPS